MSANKTNFYFDSWLAALAIFVYLAIGFWFSLATPPFETPDELYHYGFTHHLAQGHWLPVQSEEVSGPWEQEGSQAPLYYFLTGWLTRGIDQSDFAQISPVNPHANIGDPLYPGNKNRMLYSGRAFPLTGAVLALRMGRWLSLLLCASSLFCTWRLAQMAWPRSRTIPLLALWIVATIPQFAFIGASHSNDSIIIATAAWALYWLACMLCQSSDSRIRPFDYVVLGLLLGLVGLSKLQGLGLLPLVGLALLWLAWQRRTWQPIIYAALLTGPIFLAVAGWWYWRNYTLYGDWFGITNLLSINGGRQGGWDWAGLWGEFRGLRYSFWGLFGWFSILLPGWFYLLMDGVTVVAILGVIGALCGLGGGRGEGWHTPSGKVRLTQPQEDPPTTPIRWLVYGWALIGLALLIYWSSQATGSQGRLLFPSLGVYAILLALGLEVWVRKWPGLLWLLPALLLAMSLTGLLVLYPAAYQQPIPLAALPAQATPVNVTYRHDNDQIEIIGVSLSQPRYAPGEPAQVTLYLRTATTPTRDYPLFLQLLDEQERAVGNITTHPGWGRNPTTLWQPGLIYADTYLVPVSEALDLRSHLLARVYAGFTDPASRTHTPLPALDADGKEVRPWLAEVVLEVNPPENAPSTATGEGQPSFGNVLQLEKAVIGAVDSSQQVTITLDWLALGPPATDYTLFVHLLDSEGQQVTGSDAPPAGLRLPTHYWRKGDRVESTVTMSLGEGAGGPTTAGTLAVWVGFYESASAGTVRLPVTDSAGLGSGDGMVQVGEITDRPAPLPPTPKSNPAHTP